jgi:hypothetical protein
MKNIFSKVKTSYLAQPDSYTCQSTAIAMSLNKTGYDILKIRAELLQNGTAGDPYNMGRLLKKELGDRYKFEVAASLKDIRSYLDAGEFLIAAGYFSQSGHVICLDGYQVDNNNMSYKLDVRDPYGEFNAKSWSYSGTAQKYDGYYSSYLIYATCVKGQSYSDARRIYQRGELDSSLPGAWIHRVFP